MTNVKILCIIPARSGSKDIPHKNIKLFKGKPLIYWSIFQAQQSKYEMKIVVSTDSKKYSEMARKLGAEVPFIRPSNISGDLSLDLDFIKHCLGYLQKHEKYVPDIILHLRPTQPCRKVSDIDKCLSLFIKNRSNYDSLRTVIPFTKSPFKMYTINKETLIPLFDKVNNIKEPYNQCRQMLPQCYLHNGYIDIFNYDIISKCTISGTKIFPYVMEEEDNIDIDSLKDFDHALLS